MAEEREEMESTPYIDSIKLNLVNGVVCSNINRASIMYLLSKRQNNEMQAEKIAYKLGISHRTTLYHLNILNECGYIEVRKFRKKGLKMLRSVWGLNFNNKEKIDKALMKIQRNFDPRRLEKLVNKNVTPR